MPIFDARKEKLMWELDFWWGWGGWWDCRITRLRANPTYPTYNESTGAIQYRTAPLQQIFAAPQYPPKDKQLLAA